MSVDFVQLEKSFPYIREFPVAWRTDRDAEVPVFMEFFLRTRPESLYDFGAHYSDQTYLPKILPHLYNYMGIDLQPSAEIEKLMNDNPHAYYVVDDFNSLKLYDQKTMVICISTLEHVGVYVQKPDRPIEWEQDLAFERCLEMARAYVFLSFPVGLPNFIPGEFSTITEAHLSRWEYRLRPYSWTERFFFTEGAQAGHPWREHQCRDFAVTRPYVETVGNQSICVLEICK